jgi:23S rRNA (adenine2503-C2)-methyltransferase
VDCVRSRYDLEADELAELLVDEPPYRARQVFEGLHRGLRTPEEMTELPAAMRSALAARLPSALDVEGVSVSDDGETTKWAYRLADGAIIETVLMGYRDRVTVCVSSQAGCAMGCTFCATGQGGFRRHLSTGEIVEQVVLAARAALPRRLSNVVFMGMGEPLANYDRLMGAVRRINGPIGIGARKMTISTVGVVPGIRRLAEEPLEVGLAVSLHAANDVTRDSLVPLNRRYPLGVLADACEAYVEATHRRLSFEWALIDSVNDTPKDVAELAAYARPLRAHINLIPLNPTPGYLVRGSSAERVADFAAELAAQDVTVTVRNTRGRDIDAACGQLAARVDIGPPR